MNSTGLYNRNVGKAKNDSQTASETQSQAEGVAGSMIDNLIIRMNLFLAET